MNAMFKEAFEYKIIYIFMIDDEAHKGCVKIGDTTVETSDSIDRLTPNSRQLNEAARKRIDRYTKTAAISYELLHTELAIRTVRDQDNKPTIKAFRDKDVHRVLKNSGFPRKSFGEGKGHEWYEVTLNLAIKAIQATKLSRLNINQAELPDQRSPIIFRPEQEDAIKKTLTQFKIGNRMLWNAKMRFGKTLCALQVLKEARFKKTIILTHRPVVDDGWYKDFQNIFYDNEEYEYVSKGNGSAIQSLLKNDKHIVYFASIQDLRGSSMVGGRYDKNEIVFETEWDFVVVDEAHEGTTTTLGEDVIKNVVKEESEYPTKFLALSGTPFNILDKYEDNIYTWDYVMEQQSKYNWDEEAFGDSNPYDELPELRIYTYDLGKILTDSRYEELEDKAFNFREFFRVWTGDLRSDRVKLPEGVEVGSFYHEKDVRSFLDLITRSDDNSHYPYSTVEYRNLFQHSLWMVPGVREARALSLMLRSHPIFGSGAFDIINVAGDGDSEEEAADALVKVRQAIANAGDNYTITLSCGRLTTGVTVPEWTAVFMLAGSFSTSASNYLQTIFRVQSPCNKDGKIKQCCYVFDFAPDRTLKMVAEAAALSTRAGKASESDRRIMGEFLNYCPIIAVSGTKMKSYDTNRLLQQLKRAYAERAVKNGFDDTNLYNDELLKLDDMALQEFQNLKRIVGSSKAASKTNDIDVNNQGFTEEEYEQQERISKKPKAQRTPEEEALLAELKEKKKQRRDAITVLRAISIRMPLLIYGADIDINEDVTMEDLVELVDDSSWEEFMPDGVDKDQFKKFIKYYDKEVFIAAGRRIRNIVKSADDLPPTERIGKITTLLSCFKNPDKETVLTPWRVVNMHLAHVLGGYTFFDEKFNYEMNEPQYIDQGVVTDETLNNCDAKILEMNSKTGLYPLYVAYSIYRRKCLDFDLNSMLVEDHVKAWAETIRQNIFVICKTPMAKSITRRTLVGYKNVAVNARYFKDLNNMMEHKPKQLKERVLRGHYWKIEGVQNMKFDAVVGNPPYQETTSNTSDKPVYHLFMDSAFALSNRATFIHPARFLFNAGKTPKSWNMKMLNDKHFKVIWYKPDSTEVFPTADIKGGIAVTFRDETQDFGSIGTFSIFPEVTSIMEKVLELDDFVSISSSIYLQNKFNLEVLYSDHQSYRNVIGSQGKEKRLTTSIFEQLPVFTENKESTTQIEVAGLISNARTIRYLERRYIEEGHENLDKYKVILPKSNGSGAFGEALSTPLVITPNVGYTQSFISIGEFESSIEADAALKYIKTKFARCMLSTLKVTQDNNKPTWANVPMQNFTTKSDIDWSQSVPQIDQQLYGKYNLSADEIKFIEEKVMAME